MNEIKAKELTCVKCGLVFPAHGTMWKVINYDWNSNLWLCQNWFEKSEIIYKSEEKIREIFGIPLDK